MKILADENIDDAVVAQLRDVGHEVWYVAEFAGLVGAVEGVEEIREIVTTSALVYQLCRSP